MTRASEPGGCGNVGLLVALALGMSAIAGCGSPDDAGLADTGSSGGAASGASGGGAGVAGMGGGTAGASGAGVGGVGAGGAGAGAGAGGVSGAAGSAGGVSGGGGAPSCVDASCIAELALGGYHSCARLGDGSLRCWGSNMAGQIGVVTTTEQVLSPREPVPVVVPGVVAKQLALGDWHTCALGLAGEVLCWGNDALGAAGLGLACKPDEACGSEVPTKVALPEAATSVAAGGNHACALLASGQVACWGENFHGQLGPNGKGSSKLAPQLVPGIAGATRVAAGGGRSCALVGGEARCWGYLGGAPCEDGGTGSPVVIADTQGSTELVVSAGHGCVLGATGARCWGENAFGELGVATPLPSCGKGTPWEPAAHPVASAFAAFAVGGGHLCRTTPKLDLACWGANGDGQLGIGTTTATAAPDAIPALPFVSLVATGRAHSCAVSVGTLYCWGSNWYGQVGDGHSYAESKPLSPTAVLWP